MLKSIRFLHFSANFRARKSRFSVSGKLSGDFQSPVAESVIGDLFKEKRQKSPKITTSAETPNELEPSSKINLDIKSFSSIEKHFSEDEPKNKPKFLSKSSSENDSRISQERYQMKKDMQLNLAEETQQTLEKNESDWYIGKYHENSNSTATPKWMQSIAVAEARAKGQESDVPRFISGTEPDDRIIEIIMKTLNAENAKNILVLDVRHKSDTVDFMFIAEGHSPRHLYAIADSFRRLFKHSYNCQDGLLPHNLSIAGDETNWMVVDVGRFMLHSFLPESRKFYNLEGLWNQPDELISPSKQTYLMSDEELANSIIEACQAGLQSPKLSMKSLEAKDLLTEEDIQTSLQK